MVDDHVLDLGRRHPADRTVIGSALHNRLADVIAVELVATPCVGWAHGATGRPKQQTLEQSWSGGAGAPGPHSRAPLQGCTHLVPEVAGDDGLMLAGIGRALVDGVADVDAVVQQLVEEALVDELAPSGANAFRDKRPRQGGCRSHRHKPLEDHADDRGLGFLYDELAVLDLIAQRNVAAHPHAAFARGSDLVANALADDLTLELGEGQQNVEREPPHRRRRVERLRDADKGDVVPIEHLDQLGKIHQRARQPVDLVDDHHIDVAFLDVAEQAF